MAVFDVTVRVEIDDETLAEIRKTETRGDEFVEKAIRHYVTDETFNGDVDSTGRFVINLREVG